MKITNTNRFMMKRILLLIFVIILNGCCAVFAQPIKFNGFSGSSISKYQDFSASVLYHDSFLITDGDPRHNPNDPAPSPQYLWELYDWNVQGDNASNFVRGEFTVTFDDNRSPTPLITVDFEHTLDETDVVVYIRIKVTRVSKYGTQTEVMTIRLTNWIYLVVTPSRECWKDGEAIQKSDFMLKVDPPECLPYIDVDAESDCAHAGITGESEQVVYFTYRGKRLPNVSSTIDVVEDVTYINIEYAIEDDEVRALRTALNMIRKMASGVKQANKYMKMVENSFFCARYGLKFTYKDYFQANLSVSKKCCQGKPVKFVYGGCHVGEALGFEVNIPTKIPWLVIKVGLDGSLDLTIADNYISLSGDGRKCGYGDLLPVTLDAGISVGPAAEFPLGLEASIVGIGGFSCEFPCRRSSAGVGWTVTPGEFGLYVKVKVEVDLQVAKVNWEWKLLP